jgi:hypothetical protein
LLSLKAADSQESQIRCLTLTALLVEKLEFQMGFLSADVAAVAGISSAVYWDTARTWNARSAKARAALPAINAKVREEFGVMGKVVPRLCTR